MGKQCYMSEGITNMPLVVSHKAYIIVDEVDEISEDGIYQEYGNLLGRMVSLRGALLVGAPSVQAGYALHMMGYARLSEIWGTAFTRKVQYRVCMK